MKQLLHTPTAVLLSVVCALSLMVLATPLYAVSSAAVPLIIAISPNHIYNDQATMVTITGVGFAATPIVIADTTNANHQVLSNVTFIDSITISVIIPAKIFEGVYSITVMNPDGQKSDSINDFIIMNRGDGTIAPWVSTSPMTTLRWRFAAVVAHGYIYAIGGNGRDSSVILSSIERAKLDTDGSISSWQIVGALSMPRAGLTAVVLGNDLYVLGGETGGFGPNQSSVERFALNSDGSLGPAQVVASMTTPRADFAAVAVGEYLYALGGFPGNGTALKTVERAARQVDGTLGPWELTASMTMPRSRAVVSGRVIYALGGDNTIERSIAALDGSLGPWQIISVMVAERSQSSAFVDGPYMYVLGGFYPGLYATNSIERAMIQSDGSLGPWQLSASMSQGRSSFVALALNQRIYAMGGMIGQARTERSAEYATIRTFSHYIFIPLIVR